MTTDHAKTKAQLISELESLRRQVAELQAAETATQQMQEALLESRERTRSIVETAVDGIITIDGRGLVDTFNPAAERLFGYSADEVIGKSVNLLMPSPYHEEHDDYIERYTKTGQAKIIGIGREVVAQHKDGSLFPIELAVSEMHVDHRQMFTGILHDITERKHAEKALADLNSALEEKNQELETIVYVASHDLRSPLINIQGFSRELSHACQSIRATLSRREVPDAITSELAGVLDQDIPEALEYILTGSQKMESLLNGLLRLSRVGKASSRIVRVDMNTVMSNIITSLEFQVKGRKTTVTVEDLPSCRGDAMQITQVFANLFDNALKYLDPARPGVIQVTGRRETGRAVYCVKDNGIGIPPSHQKKVFELFHRLNPHDAGGEGLGLTIVHRILERHQGTIWMESEAGAGSAFFVALPIGE